MPFKCYFSYKHTATHPHHIFVFRNPHKLVNKLAITLLVSEEADLILSKKFKSLWTVEIDI